MTTIESRQFRSREEAGRKLANQLEAFSGDRNVIILALPAGGVPVAAEISKVLRRPYDILLVRPINAPGGGDRALGAVTGGGVRMLDWALIDRLKLSESDISTAILAESMELTRREQLYRGTHPSHRVADRTVILADDGTTPCSTIRDAIRLLRRQHAERVVVALPTTCSHSVCELRMEADDVITLVEREPSHPAGKWFEHFPDISDDEVCRLMAER